MWIPRWLLAAIAWASACEGVVVRTANHSGLLQHNSSSRPPRVYFLFLAVDKISNLDIWTKFFANAPTDQYRALVHCKLQSCNQQVVGTPLFAVPAVPSYYCTDLVSPMNQLLAWAVYNDRDQGSNPADKFAFVSDSSLPAKPFSVIYNTLSARRGSDFCVFPSNEWADIPSSTSPGEMDMAVKYHQWITLEREHTEKALQLWSAGHLHNFMSLFGMNAKPYSWQDNSFADNRNFGCLDEFWHMAAIYGTISGSASQPKNVPLSMFAGGPLQISGNAGWQGECDTFVMWSKYLHTLGKNPFHDFHSALDPISVPHAGNAARPGWWDTISTTGLRAIRQSTFLFARKFVDKPRLHDGPNFPDAYAQIVLGH